MKLKLMCLFSFLFASVAMADTVILTKDNMLTLNDGFYGETVANLTKQAKDLDARVASTDTIYLVLNSHGGLIDAGIELKENLNNLKRPVKTITLFAASMGFQTVQGVNGERLIVADGTLMSHKAKGGFSGEFPGQLDSRYGYYLKRIQRLDEQAVKRTNGKHTLQSYRNLIENEYWCDGQDCVAQGFADKVVTVQCDKSLDGTKSQMLDQFLFMGHTIEIRADYDNCPLNTNALAYHILIDGEPLFKESKQDPSKTVQKNDAWYSMFGYGNSSGYSSSSPSLTKEEMAEIQKKVDTIIQKSKFNGHEVIKGY